MESRMVQINPQVYALLQSHISDHISFKAQKEVREQMMQDTALMILQRENPQEFKIRFDNAVATAAAEITSNLVMGEMQANINKQDPLVRIKQQEIDLRAMDLQRKANEARERQAGENFRQQNNLTFDYDRLKQQNEQSDKRLDIAEQKLDIQRNK